jgi:anti-sigma B factor antagonist
MDAQGKSPIDLPAGDAFDAPLRVAVRAMDLGHVVEVSGAVAIHEADELKHQLCSIVTRERPNIVLDLSGLIFVSSTGLAGIVAAHAAAKKLKGNAYIVNPQANISQLLRITRVSEIVPVFNSIEAACAAFRA